MIEEKLKKVEAIERKNTESFLEKNRRLDAALEQLRSILTDEFYDDVYDFSDQEKQLEYINAVKRLFHPKAIQETEVKGKIQKSIVTKNYAHNNEDKSMVLDRIYINWILKSKNGLGKPNGIDSTQIPKAEYKSTKNKSDRLNISDNLKIGQIDKIDEKDGAKHNIYNPQSKVSLVSGIFENNSNTPIVVFHVERSEFQSIIHKLIEAKAAEYKFAINEIALINEKIRSKQPGYRVGDTVQLSHLKNETTIKGDEHNPQLIQTPRDTLDLTIGDFISSPGLRIIHLDEKWKFKVNVDRHLLVGNPSFCAQLKQFYTSDEFNKFIFKANTVKPKM